MAELETIMKEFSVHFRVARQARLVERRAGVGPRGGVWVHVSLVEKVCDNARVAMAHRQLQQSVSTL